MQRLSVAGWPRPWCAVLGSPIRHSRSPLLHSTAYRALGLDWEYRAYQVTEAELVGFVNDADPGLRGLSLTMPLKRAGFELARRAGGEVRPEAAVVEAANTLVFDAGRLVASNTDIAGLRNALRERGVRDVRRVLVLGAGATAAAILAALTDLGLAEVVVVVRDPSRATAMSRLADRLGVTVSVLAFDHLDRLAPAGWFDLVASSLPGGAADPYAELCAGLAGAVFDAAYEPWPTRLAAAADRAGAVTVSGLDLLLHQAGLQVEEMTGRAPAPLAQMRAALG